MGKSHAALAAGDSAVAHRGSIAYVLAMKLSKMLLVVLALLVSFRLAGLAETQQPMPASVATGFNLIREDTLRADLTFLASDARSEEHTSELQSRLQLVCRLLLEKKRNPQSVRSTNAY